MSILVPDTRSPLIKWTGSKRHLAQRIIEYFPREIDTYCEPFVGGGSVFFELLRSSWHNVKSFVVSDINPSLIKVLKLVQGDFGLLSTEYRRHWELLQKNPEYFYEAREKYNKTGSETLFYFLTRTCYNGTIRYNSKGEFNTSHHFNRAGMHPNKVFEILWHYHNLMQDKDIHIIHSSFEKIAPKNFSDVVYLDPPYTNSKSLYFGNIDFPYFMTWVDDLPCSWFMNINDINGKDNEIGISLPYSGKVVLSSGNSSFSRMKKKMVNVGEYFYWREK